MSASSDDAQTTLRTVRRRSEDLGPVSEEGGDGESPAEVAEEVQGDEVAGCVRSVPWVAAHGYDHQGTLRLRAAMRTDIIVPVQSSCPRRTSMMRPTAVERLALRVKAITHGRP